MVLKWLTDALGTRDLNEIDVRMRRAPVIFETMKQIDQISAQEVAALDKLAAAAPALMLEIAQAPIAQRAEAFDRALEIVSDHVAVLRRALRERRRSRAWPQGDPTSNKPPQALVAITEQRGQTLLKGLSCWTRPFVGLSYAT
jgi:hypothetical protein